MARTAKRYEQKAAKPTCFSKRKYSVGIYSRLSVDHEDRKSESIENQIEIIRQYIEQVNHEVNQGQKLAVYDTYTDRGISGAFFEREDFVRLMNDVRNHRVDCIIVKDLSRFGRDYLETGNYIEKILPFLGVRFIAVTDGFDSMSKDASGQNLSMNIKNLVNDMYAKDISKKVSTSRKLAAQKGSYIGSTPPYGYFTEYSNGIRKLVIHPESAGIVCYLFESCAKGVNLKEITSALYSRKVHRISDFHKYSHTFCQDGEILQQWEPETIKGIVLNPVYTGKLIQGKTKTRLSQGQKGACHTEENKWITVENSHEAIVEQCMFEQAGEGLKKTITPKENRYKVTDEENIFRNIIYCKQCGRKMHAAFYRSRTTKKRSYAYLCKRAYYIDDRKCEKNYVREEIIRELVAEQIRKMLQEQGISSRKLTALNEAECDRIKEKYGVEQEKIIQETQRLFVQAGEMYMQYKEGGLSAREYSVFRENKAEYGRFCVKKMDEIKKKTRKAEIQMKEQNQCLRSLGKAGGCGKLNLQLAETLIDKILISPDGEITICFKFCKGDTKKDDR